MFVLTSKNSIANKFLAELRDLEVQKDSMRFRKNMERLGEILAYEISKKLTYKTSFIQTSLGTAETSLPDQNPVLAVILRAGVPFFQGFLNYFDKSECAFIAAYRASESGNKGVEINMDYIAGPSIENKPLILIDPMLATGSSVSVAYNSILKTGKPSSLHIASVIATTQAVDFLNQSIKELNLWTVGLDEKLNEKFYIVPGLGDAGDLAFGEKL